MNGSLPRMNVTIVPSEEMLGATAESAKFVIWTKSPAAGGGADDPVSAHTNTAAAPARPTPAAIHPPFPRRRRMGVGAAVNATTVDEDEPASARVTAARSTARSRAV